MIKIDLKYDGGIPQYSCNSCCTCDSTFGISLCKIKNRGCCWYYPKFTLYEIHKMVKSEEGMEVLNKILNLPRVKIYNYYIHAKGFFDKEGYEKFLNSAESKKERYIKHDETMFFRACPFVKPGEGCVIPDKFRSYVCNFFICEEVTDKVNLNEEFTNYIEERENYIKWIDWENTSIQMMLENQNLDLVDNWDEVINILKEMPVEHYEFIKLKPITIE